MNMRGVWLTSVAVAASFATSAGADEAVATEKPAPVATEATLTPTAEIVANMRELLLAVAPEISLPAIEIRLPTLRVEQR